MDIDRISRLHFITQGVTKEEVISEAENYFAGGGDWIQLRMKGASDELFYDLAYSLRKMSLERGATLIINDRVDIAKVVDADGVHIGKNDADYSVVRDILGKDKIIGCTANTFSDVMNIISLGADYIGLGPFRFTTTKKNLSPIIGIAGYRDVVSELNQRGLHIPIVAIGGVTVKDIDDIIEAGIYGIAVSGLISNSSNSRNTTKIILRRICKK